MNGAYRIRCSEIFGGNQLADTDLCTSGLTASIFSSSSQGRRGGDVYYLSVCSSDQLTRVAVLDVRGHGEQVSHISDWLYESLDRHMNSLDGDCVLADLNAQVHRHGFEAITTAAVLGYYIGDESLYFAYAGHPPALFRRRSGDWTALQLSDTGRPANLPLGVMSSVHYDQQRIAAERGDRFVLHTDGVLDCPAPDGVEFGDERLSQALGAHGRLPLSDFKAAVAAELRTWARGDLSHDDCTFMALEIAGH